MSCLFVHNILKSSRKSTSFTSAPHIQLRCTESGNPGSRVNSVEGVSWENSTKMVNSIPITITITFKVTRGLPGGPGFFCGGGGGPRKLASAKLRNKIKSIQKSENLQEALDTVG